MSAAYGGEFAAALIAWQRRCGRHDLPWQRGEADAYRVWLAEIMLQQTQVGTVIPYYARFLARFPDVEALAGAPLEAVLGLWSGLGYYARARNLHRCAQVLVAEHGGRFPRRADALAALPGIGRSTAAAIAAFAYGARAAILDGNVKRVLCRCFGVEGYPGTPAVERQLWQLAEALLPPTAIESYTQGLMDLGATLCRRRRPACGECPMQGRCLAHAQGREAELPSPRPPRRLPERTATVLVLMAGEAVLLETRPPQGIWGGLLALPEAAEGEPPAAAALRLGLVASDWQPLPAVRHTFTHFHLTLEPWLAQVMRAPGVAAPGRLRWLGRGEIAAAALPSPIRRLLEGLT